MVTNPNTLTCIPSNLLGARQGKAGTAATIVTGTARFGDNDTAAGGQPEVTLDAGGNVQQGHHTWATWPWPFCTDWQFVTFSVSNSAASFRAGISPQLTGALSGRTVGAVQISVHCGENCSAEWKDIEVHYYRNGVRTQGARLPVGCIPGCSLRVRRRDDPRAANSPPVGKARVLSPDSVAVVPECPDNTSVVVTGSIRFCSGHDDPPDPECMSVTVAAGVN